VHHQLHKNSNTEYSYSIWLYLVVFGITVTVFGTAKPCNPQGSQRLMGEAQCRQLVTERPCVLACFALNAWAWS
jgi:hypothetical protein